MTQYEARIDDGVCYLDGDEGRIEVGEIDTIVDLVGGETYTIEYDNKARQAAWLNTDDDGTITFEVRDTIDGYAFGDEFVTNLVNVDPDETDEDGNPARAAFFAEMLTRIWDSKGNLESA